jgi:formate/nitrite transporter FocA (FNT family)
MTRDYKEEQVVDQRKRLAFQTVYEIIRREGVEELNRPALSLWWSGVAAGLGISVSLLAMGLLRVYLPDTEWMPLVEKLGYTMGFLIVVLGRLQLFTENTITVVLPFLAEASMDSFRKVVRLWSIVLSANMFGTFLFASVVLFLNIVQQHQIESMLEVAHEFADKNFREAFLLGIPAGFLIAALVWMLPSSESFEFFVIISMTYLIGIGDFTHVIAGSTEIFMLMLNGDVSLVFAIAFITCMGLGNIAGGTGLFAILTYLQVEEELS